MANSQRVQITLPAGQPRVLLANNTTAASAFPTFARVSQSVPRSVDTASAPTLNYAVVPVPEYSGAVVTLQFGGVGSNNNTGAAQILMIPKAVLPAPGATGTAEYVAQWLADLSFTISTTDSNIAGSSGGALGGSGFFLADTITSTAAAPTAAMNVISPADDTNPASVQINHNNAAYLVVLMHRNSSLTSVNGIIMFG